MNISCFARLMRVAMMAAPVLLATAAAAQATVIYDSTGGAENGGDPLATTGAGPILADRIVATFTGAITSVSLNLALTSAAATGGFTVNLYADLGSAGPGAATLIANGSDASLTGSYALYSFLPSAPVTLTAGQSYYVGVTNNNSNAMLGNTVDALVLGRPAVVRGTSYYNNSGVQANAGGPYEIIVNETAAVPEPASLVLLMSGLAGTALVRRKQRIR